MPEPEFDALRELGKLIDEAGLVLYAHFPGCSMKPPCACSKVAHLVRDLREEVKVLREGSTAAHAALDKAGVVYETAVWDPSGKFQKVTEYPVCDRIKFLSSRATTAQSALTVALEALEAVGPQEVPERGHTGSCGPEAGCDGLCMAAAYVSERNFKVARAITVLKAILPKPEVER